MRQHAALAALTLTGLAAAVALATQTAAGGKAEAVQPFNGCDLTGWKLKGNKARSQWVVGRATLDAKDPRKLAVAALPPQADGGPAARWLINKSGGVDLYTEQKFGDGLYEIEFMVPKGSNSGIYLMGEYEVQILDSFGRQKVGPGDLGGLYGAAAPRVNAARAPGQWQRFVIAFQAPRFEGGQRVRKAKFLKITLNDQIIHENVEMNGPTPGGLTGKEHPTGPLLFQGDHGPVAFRGIRITPRKFE
jgi:hypothetical protein